MGKRAYRVMQEANKVRKLFYGSEYPCKITDCQYDDYISDNKDNDAVLDSVLSGKGIKLLIAPTGSGKTSALISRADRLVANNKDYRVVFGLPTRALASQMGNNSVVRTMVGGDSFDGESPLIATTYEKMYEVENHIACQKIQGATEKNVLVLDESHLLTTQHTFRQDAIKAIIRCIEKKDFHSIVLVTATPEPMSLFHSDEVLEFYSSNRKPSIDRLEIIEVDDPVEYIKGIDYSKEFPFIRLNKTEEIDKLMAQMPQTMAKITSADRNTKTYLDIVEHGKIDGTGIDGVLVTSLLEAGVSITDYPENIVPIAVFPNNNISADDIEQFLNRIRVKGNKHVKCARVVVKKPLPREIKVSLIPYKDSSECICEFQDIHMEMGNLTIDDTGILDSVADGKYRLKFEIGDSIFYRYITVSSDGVTSEKMYSKKDMFPIVFEGIGFRQFYDILKDNFGEKESLSFVYEMLEMSWEKRKQGLNLSDDKLEMEKRKYEDIVRRTISGFIHEAGEIGECLSFAGKEVSIDKRICFEVSYRQFQRQYYHNHDILAEELKFRLDTDVVLMEQDTPKGKKAPRNKEDIWDGIEDLRQEIEKNSNDRLWLNIMGRYDKFSYLPLKWDIVKGVKEQEHLMEILKSMEKEDITGKTALCILSSSRSQRKINEYIKYFHMISCNQMLEQCNDMEIKELCSKVKKKELVLQAVIYSYLEQKGVQSPKITEQLEKDILEYYRQSFPNISKYPKESKIGRKITKMYKSRGKERIDKVLKTNMEDIFTLVKSDYK